MAGDENLHVDPKALSKYGMQMLLYSAQAAMPVTTQLANVEVDASSAFAGLSGFQAGVFAEGPLLQAAMAKQQYAFSAFANDLVRGLTAIGNAADVCAYAYNSTDIEAAEKMDLLGYAFATDPDAKPPAGLPKGTGETMLDEQLENGSGSGLPQALTDPDGGNTVQVYGSGWLTTYSDGSTKMVETREVSGDPTAGRAITTVTGPGGQVLNVTTTETRYRADGTSTEYYRQVVTPSQTVTGADGKPQKTDERTVTTKSTPQPDGGQEITTTTQVGKGKPATTTTHVGPPATAGHQPAPGPLEQAQDVLGPKAGKVDWRKGYQGVEAPS